MPNQQAEWQKFRAELDAYEKSLGELNYSDPLVGLEVEDYRRYPYGLPATALSIEQINSLLNIKPPHGYKLISPPLPSFPLFPKRPPDLPKVPHPPKPLWRKLILGEADIPEVEVPTSEEKRQILRRAEALHQKATDLKLKFFAEASKCQSLKEGCAENKEASIKILMSMSRLLQWVPKPVRLTFDVDIDLGARIALCTIEIPDFSSLEIMKMRQGARQTTWVRVSSAEKNRATEIILYSLCIRAACLVVNSDEGNWFDTIAVNARQNWNDRATGQPRTGIIASLQATSEELIRLRLDQVDPKACFRHLKGIATPSVEDIAAVRPIFVLNPNDSRIVKERDVAQGLNEDANLAAMPWDDFEHLVRQLYEWEFGNYGAEVKVTRSSRDRGVDAIVFDPDPLRGGKFVIQAKRYTRPVDVAAVRDLYGTLLNEGANRGILVTTSSYGPDAYAFARDKPISLVDGPNLIAMLRKHGRHYKIDLEEARRLGASAGGNL